MMVNINYKFLNGHIVITNAFGGTYNDALILVAGHERKLYISEHQSSIPSCSSTLEIEVFRGFKVEHVAVGGRFIIVRTRTLHFNTLYRSSPRHAFKFKVRAQTKNNKKKCTIKKHKSIITNECLFGP